MIFLIFLIMQYQKNFRLFCDAFDRSKNQGMLPQNCPRKKGEGNLFIVFQIFQESDSNIIWQLTCRVYFERQMLFILKLFIRSFCIQFFSLHYLMANIWWMAVSWSSKKHWQLYTTYHAVTKCSAQLPLVFLADNQPPCVACKFKGDLWSCLYCIKE